MDFRAENTEFLRDVIKTLKQQFNARDLIASGFAVNSLRVVANQFISAQIVGRKYTQYLQTGFKEKPKNVSRSFVDGIRLWMETRGILPKRNGVVVPSTETNIKRSAFAIARGIVQRGTSINRGRAGLDFEMALEMNKREHLEKIGKKYRITFEEKLKIK